MNEEHPPQPTGPSASPAVKIGFLWASAMFLYIYNDYFVMFMPGTIDSMAEGDLGPFGQATEITMLVVAVILAIPALMISLSVLAPGGHSRWLNVVVGGLYTVIEALTLIGSPLFYRVVVVLEILVTATIVWIALTSPGLRPRAGRD